MNRLFLTWLSYKRKSYIPIGVLQKDEELYKFTYFYESAVDAFKEGCSLPFPLQKEPIESNTLFPFFKDRVMAVNRENLEEYLTSMNLEKYDEFLLLSMTKGKKVNDNFTVFTPEEFDKSLNSDKAIS